MPTLPRLDRVSDTECEPSDDSAGEKEAKRQRSEPTTPVSTSGRLPYDYDAVMGITKVGTKEVEGFGEDLDTSEYHDAAEEPSRKDESDDTVEPQRLSDFQGGYGSSSLKECIELLTTTTRIAPAPLDSGDGQKAAAPPQKPHKKTQPRLKPAKPTFWGQPGQNKPQRGFNHPNQEDQLWKLERFGIRISFYLSLLSESQAGSGKERKKRASLYQRCLEMRVAEQSKAIYLRAALILLVFPYISR